MLRDFIPKEKGIQQGPAHDNGALIRVLGAPREGGSYMLSEIPKDLGKMSKKELDKEICRVGMIAELDAVNLYEQLAAMTDNKLIKDVLMDIAREEKTHVGEFQTLLLMEDQEQVKELEEGKEEVEEMKG
jgi:rubrerythrin